MHRSEFATVALNWSVLASSPDARDQFDLEREFEGHDAAQWTEWALADGVGEEVLESVVKGFELEVGLARADVDVDRVADDDGRS